MYYQFGRKDPFPGPTTLSVVSSNSENSTSKISVGFSGTSSTRLTYANWSSSTQTTATAVQNPLKLYGTSSAMAWCTQYSTLGNTSYLWYDITKAYNSGLKSIFDPSPAGWKIPMADWANGADNVAYSSYVKTLFGIARYPAHGLIACGSSAGVMYGGGYYGRLYSSRAYSSINAYQLYFITSSISTATTSSHTGVHAGTIRCVQE